MCGRDGELGRVGLRSFGERASTSVEVHVRFAGYGADRPGAASPTEVAGVGRAPADKAGSLSPKGAELAVVDVHDLRVGVVDEGVELWQKPAVGRPRVFDGAGDASE